MRFVLPDLDALLASEASQKPRNNPGVSSFSIGSLDFNPRLLLQRRSVPRKASEFPRQPRQGRKLYGLSPGAQTPNNAYESGGLESLLNPLALPEASRHVRRTASFCLRPHLQSP